ncbi:MAG TPA: SIR2 family protein [Polyangiaceae bacterium]|nr:SIR2 family protein [Polyangiaceae bacterium]
MPNTAKPLSLEWLLNIRYNHFYFHELLRSYQRGEVTPFIGAGLSVPYGLPSWSTFLLALAEGPHARDQVQVHIQKGEFEEAAQLLAESLSLERLEEQIRVRFSEQIGMEPTSSAMALIPKLFPGAVVTTNFDRVLERAYSKPPRTIPGALADAAVEALKDGSQAIIKLHGDASHRQHRVLTLEEYDAHYGAEFEHAIRQSLPSLLNYLFNARTVLFLGASLGPDRTIRLLRQLRPTPQHFAFLALPDDPEEASQRDRFLCECRIRPIWFPSGRYDAIPVFLKELDSSQGTRGKGDASSITKTNALDGATPPRPSTWWIASIGWLSLRRSADFVKAFQASLPARLQANLGLQIALDRGDREFAIGDERGWERTARATSNEKEAATRIVVGGAGIGKSRFVAQWLEADSAGVSLTLFCRADVLWSATRDPDVLWDVLYRQVTESVGGETLSRLAFGFLMRRKRWQLVVEDTHHVATLRAMTTALHEQLRRAFGKRARYRLYLTSRERLSLQDKLFLSGASVIELTALTQLEAQEFFQSLCQKNGAPHGVAVIGKALEQAFTAESSRTPLFVVICAWLATVSAVTPEDVSKILAMKSAELFRKLHWELWRRARSLSGWSFEGLLQAQGALAKRHWPNWAGIEVSAADAALQQHSEPGAPPLSSAELTRDGFLVRSPGALGPETISFPHQSIADFLLVSELLRTRDLSPLRAHAGSQRMEGLSEFFAAQASSSEELSELASLDLPLYCRSFRGWLIREPRTTEEFSRAHTRSAELVATCLSDAHEVSENAWLEVCSALADRYQPWRSLFCQCLEGVLPNATNIQVLLAVSGDPCRALLATWLAMAPDTFRALLARPALREFVEELAQREGWSTLAGWVAFGLLWDPLEREARSRLTGRISSSLARASDQQLEVIVQTDQARLAAVLEFASLEQRQRVARLYAKVTGWTLVPVGEYPVNDRGKERSVQVRAAILVRCEPTILRGVYTSESANAAVQRKVVASAIMTEWHGRVVQQYFSDPRANASAPYEGVVFRCSDATEREVLRTKAYSYGLYFITRTGAPLVPPAGGDNEIPIRSLAWHEMKTV